MIDEVALTFAAVLVPAHFSCRDISSFYLCELARPLTPVYVAIVIPFVSELGSGVSPLPSHRRFWHVPYMTPLLRTTGQSVMILLTGRYMHMQHMRSAVWCAHCYGLSQPARPVCRGRFIDISERMIAHLYIKPNSKKFEIVANKYPRALPSANRPD